MQECTKRNVSTETKLKFHVFQDERFVDLNLYQYGWEQTEPLHSYGPYTKNPNPSPIEKRFGFSILTAVLPLDIPTGWEPRTNKSPTGAFVAPPAVGPCCSSPLPHQEKPVHIVYWFFLVRVVIQNFLKTIVVQFVFEVIG